MKGIGIVSVIFLLSMMIIEGLIIIEGNKKASQKVDYLIVLGARLYGDVPSPSLIERLQVAHEYLENHPDLPVVVTGGQGHDERIPEAHAMATYLIDRGINQRRIIIEDQSTNTFENLSFSLNKIKEKDNKDGIKVLIATNKYHIFRSKLLAKRLGMIPYGLPAEIPPTVILKSYLREYFAVIKSLFVNYPDS